MLKRYGNSLKILAMLIGVAGYLVHNELQRRETEEIVNDILAEREAKAKIIPAEVEVPS